MVETTEVEAEAAVEEFFDVEDLPVVALCGDGVAVARGEERAPV